MQNITASTGKNPHPGGTQYQVKLPDGAIETKAAWRILTSTDQQERYLTRIAILVNPSTLACTQATMGLVGLHIVQKTPTQPQFVWATFEQVDNLPSAKKPVAAESLPPVTFNNASCTCTTPILDACFDTPPKPTHYRNCAVGQAYGEACTANVVPPQKVPTASCPAYATQVVREHNIPNSATNPVGDTNEAAHQVLIAANPKTVFQYYQLVDVLWSGSSQELAA